MKKLLTGLLLISLCSAVSVTAQVTFVRPLPPAIVSVTTPAGQVAVNFTPAPSGSVNDSFADFKYHAVLVNDLSVSLQQAYISGRAATSGPMIGKETDNPPQIVLSVSKPSRYYLAVSTSGIRKNTPATIKDRIYSGWKLFTAADSLPVQLLIGVDTTLYATGNYTGEVHSSAVAMITLAESGSTAKVFEIKNGSDSVLSIADIKNVSTTGPILVVDNIKEAVSKISLTTKTVIIKTIDGGTTFLTIYSLINNPLTASEITYRLYIKDTTSNKILAEGKIAISPDRGLENILSTTALLTHLPADSTDTTNPLFLTPQASTPDSLQVKLLASVLFHTSIAHNSPKANEIEETAGIFTNYIQYFDNIVRNWGSVNDSAVGLPRLRAIYKVVKDQNAGVVADNVWALNHGTLAEFGKPVQERKNYAFYEGYSRLYFDLERPVYNPGVQTGSGIQLKISDNIELYKANLADTFNMFDTAIINGTTARRLIVNAKDSLLAKVNTDGLWVKGIAPDDEDDKADKIWFTGVNAVRLPVQTMANGVKVDTAFSVGGEKMGTGDVGGKVVGGGGRSLLKVYALSKNNEIVDTIENIEEPGVLLHGQKRKLVYNSDYLNGNTLNFRVVTAIVDTGKVFIESHNGNSAILADTSVTSKNWFALANVSMNGILVQSIGLEGATRRLGMKDVVNGNLEVWCDNVVPIAMETDDAKLIRGADRKKLEIVLRVTGGVKLFNSAAMTQQILPDINNLLKAKREGDDYIVSWNNYADVFLKQNSIYATIEPGTAGKFEIVARWKKTKQEDVKEMVDVLGVPKIESIEFTSDHEDALGGNLLRHAEYYVDPGDVYSEPEYIFSNGQSWPISHTRNRPVTLVLNNYYSKPGEYTLVGQCTGEINLSFSKTLNVTETGYNRDTLTSSGNLPNYPIICESDIQWTIYSNTLTEQKLLKTYHSKHKFLVNYGMPNTKGSWQDKTSKLTNYFTDKRLITAIEYAGISTGSIDSAVINVWKKIQDVAITRREEPRVTFRAVWQLWDVLELNIQPGKKGFVSGQCAEHAYLFEYFLGVLGVQNALYVHILPSKDSIRVNSGLNRIASENLFIKNEPPYHEGDDRYLPSGYTDSITIRIEMEALTFFFAWYIPLNPWNAGEGSLYYNNKCYTMFTDEIVGNGSGQFQAARDVMLQFENINDSIISDSDYYLQRWAIRFQFQNEIRIKRCVTNATVQIPR